MSPLDWSLFGGYLALVVWIGLWVGRKSRTASDLFVADRSMPWYAVGLSVMATQASAVTFIGTTGKAYGDGMRFVQFYFGLPVAMLILAYTLVPLYHRARVYTAYEWLGRRFDGKTRALTGVVFLLQRALGLGFVVYAPSVVLSMLLGWSLPATIALMTVVAVAYTTLGGIRAVMWTDVLQMLLVVVGLLGALLVMWSRLPQDVGPAGAWRLAALTGRDRMLDFSFDPSSRYTVWSGLLGGTFLFLAYFGCDQSQVQRFLAGRSLAANRRALLLNGVLKIPLQLFVLFLGVTLFCVHHFDPPPLVFDPVVQAEIEASAHAQEWDALSASHAAALEERRATALAALAAPEQGGAAERAAYLGAVQRVQGVRGEALAVAGQVREGFDDTNAIFPWFVLNALPAGLLGLLLAAVFAAAMSSIDSELNALATVTVVDLYRVHFRPLASDRECVVATRLATLVWGAVAAAFAFFAASLGSVIEAVNQVGSYFYGSLLGVFVLAWFRRASGSGAFFGLLIGIACAALCERILDLAWLWLNPIGCLATLAAGLSISVLGKERAVELREEP